MSQKVPGRRSFLGISLQAQLDKILECFCKISFQPRRGVFRDEKEDLHGVNVGVGRLAIRKFESRDTE
jgi:hypothetical protein